MRTSFAILLLIPKIVGLPIGSLMLQLRIQWFQ